jgi:hypothetical protein
MSESTFECLSVIAQFGLFLSVPVSLFLYYVADRKDRARDRETNRQAFYAKIDDEYFSLLAELVHRPRLLAAARSEEEAIQYDAYALMVWNFLETIYDYCRADQQLMNTWRPILEFESRRHADWFSRSENQSKFKPEFRGYLERSGLWSPAAVAKP